MFRKIKQKKKRLLLHLQWTSTVRVPALRLPKQFEPDLLNSHFPTFPQRLRRRAESRTVREHNGRQIPKHGTSPQIKGPSKCGVADSKYGYEVG